MGIILPIDELIFFKMVIAPPTRNLHMIIELGERYDKPPSMLTYIPHIYQVIKAQLIKSGWKIPVAWENQKMDPAGPEDQTTREVIWGSICFYAHLQP
jgi:hypothetical protein